MSCRSVGATPVVDLAPEREVSTLENHPELAIIIEGHTDSVGDDACNQELSERRAASVVAYLVENGIDASRLQAVGKGESGARLPPCRPRAKTGT